MSQQEKQKTIYDLELNELLSINPHFCIQRVPGGWIYHYEHSASIAIFVPYNNEFKPAPEFTGHVDPF